MSQHRSARLPDFIAVGPARTGTTWLHKALKRHVQLPAGVKETHFFNYHYSKGIGWYESHFLHCYEDLPVGEICASYFRSGPARRRISQHLPRCRIICTVRDPVERIYSFYKLMRQNGRLKGTFEQALQDYPAMLNANHYAVHIGKWQKYFGKENVMVAVFDDLEDDSQEYLNRIASFIGIPPINLAGLRIKDEKVNTRTQAPRSAGLARMAYIVRKSLNRHRLYGVKKFLDRAGVWHFCSAGGEHFPALNPVFEMRLRNMLRPEIDALEELLQRDLSAWKAGEPEQARLAGCSK